MAERSTGAVPLRPEAARPALSAAALLFLRGRDADGRVQDLATERGRLRPVLAVLSLALLHRRAIEPLGFRCLGDYARERLGLKARTLREWARVWKALEGLPRLRGAVLQGEVSWSVARRVVAHVSPETESACLATVRGRTVRAVEAMLIAAFGETSSEATGASERVHVRVRLGRHAVGLWHAALELARRMAGETLPVWECAEAIAAESLGALPPETVRRAAAASAEPATRQQQNGKGAGARLRAGSEHGLRHAAFPALTWGRARALRTAEEMEALRAWAHGASPHALDTALRVAVRRLQEIDLDLGQILRQILERRLYRELGFQSFERYAEERADLSPRTARRRVRLARLGAASSALATAFREGTLTERQAELVGELSAPATAQGWVAFAAGVTLRRLEDEIEAVRGEAGSVSFTAPPEAASVFALALEAVRLHLAEDKRTLPSTETALVWMLAHAIAAWTEQGENFRDYADFERDGWRCTAPGCMARRNLHSHHIVFRSACGPDEPWNRTTLCAFHHHRGVHAGVVRCTGRAPEGLLFELGVRANGSPLLRAGSGDVLCAAYGIPAGILDDPRVCQAC